MTQAEMHKLNVRNSIARCLEKAQYANMLLGYIDCGDPAKQSGVQMLFQELEKDLAFAAANCNNI